MEEEKYGITDAHYLCNSAIFNTETNEILRLYQICDLLNQQEKRIKELEQENLSLQEQSIRDNQNWVEEVEQLKQSQSQLAISKLEKLFYNLQEMKHTTIFNNHDEPMRVWERWRVLECINNLIEELKREIKKNEQVMYFPLLYQEVDRFFEGKRKSTKKL